MRTTLILLICLALLPAAASQANGGNAPGADSAWLSHAQALERQGDWLTLLALGRRWTQSGESGPLAWFVLGRAYAAMGHHAEAVEAYRENLRQDPGDPYAHNNLGNSYLALGWIRPALESYRKAVRSDPGYLLAWRNLGQAYYNLKGPAGMSQVLHRLQGADPELAQAWRRLATLYALRRDARVAQAAVDILGGLGTARRERLFDLLLADI
ncbi:MAG TPA: tetratricopeptide repeat protein [Thiobacillaceae bacterium]|nr:tetratricopeptide repeat protein [Thiobacillaceae bacterium]HNU64104.1 tetratricopeptide repeat protein [Thiobacillaceae bacterium]